MRAYKMLQDEALLVSWKHQLDRDAETLKMKGNLNHLRTVSNSCCTATMGHKHCRESLCLYFFFTEIYASGCSCV